MPKLFDFATDATILKGLDSDLQTMLEKNIPLETITELPMFVFLSLVAWRFAASLVFLGVCRLPATSADALAPT